MLFHSYPFVLGFLPLCFLGFAVAVRWRGWQAGILWLSAASLVFYSQWSLLHAAILAGSIIVNYAFGVMMIRTRERKKPGFTLLMLAMACNLGLLIYFKYTNFLIDNLNAAFATSVPHLQIIYLVGISFFTFIQIGVLCEIYSGQLNQLRFSHFFLISSFFPCVTAGPILLQKEMMPQFAHEQRAILNPLRIAVALTVFGIGLFKKLVLADSIAPYADAAFNGVASGAAIDTGGAWIGALAYTLQIYFDFSGYSDMAVGIGYLFGFRLPLNFNSPLKATSIIDFWRRWHMTMTRFFTTYLYTPMGISLMRRAVKGRFSKPKRFLAAVATPVVLTFVLAGIWHGAGWTFVVFGLIHGVALAMNHAWREARLPAPPRPVGWLLTMSVVIIGLVFFRADSLDVAMIMLAGMAGFGALATPPLATVAPVLLLIAALMSIVLLFPNTQQIMCNHEISTDPLPQNSGRFGWIWQPSARWAMATWLLLAVSMGLMAGETTFVYYQF
jgi:alginate O-acetyltransferase complex protein AlgI